MTAAHREKLRQAQLQRAASGGGQGQTAPGNSLAVQASIANTLDIALNDASSWTAKQIADRLTQARLRVTILEGIEQAFQARTQQGGNRTMTAGGGDFR
jgi:hypothetical protein